MKLFSLLSLAELFCSVCFMTLIIGSCALNSEAQTDFLYPINDLAMVVAPGGKVYLIDKSGKIILEEKE